MPEFPTQPSGSARRVLEYLEIVDSAQKKQGFAKKWDFFMRARSEGYTESIINKLKGLGLIREEVALSNGKEEKRYFLTKKGETFLVIYRNNRDLVALFTHLSGDRLT